MRLKSWCVVVSVLFFAAVQEMAGAFAPVSISISEIGTPPAWTVAVDGRFSLFLNIEAPDGSVLEAEDFFPPSPNRMSAGNIEFEQTFASLDSALSFVTGEWSATEVTSRRPEDSETITRQFSVKPLAVDDLNLSAPVISSPGTGFVARNGEPFLLAWDFESLSANAEVPTRSILRSRRTEPEGSGHGTSIFSTPSGNGFSRGGGGGHQFSTLRENEPGADSNRWLFTATSNEPFPQTFELHLGSWVELDEFLDTPLLDPDRSNRPFAALSYSRFTEPLSIGLVAGSTEFTCVIPDGGILGDFDGDGAVGFTDFLTLSDNFGQIGTTYEEGDTNCDNRVGFADFLNLSRTFGQTAAATAQVPEPPTIGFAICSVGLFGFGMRQKRHRVTD